MFLLTLTGCKSKMIHIEGNLDELMEKIYTDINKEELPRNLQNTKLTEENQIAFIGESKINYQEAIASESPIGSFAHSIILIRMNEDATIEDIENAKKELQEKVDPRKWICVGVEKVHVESNEDLILVVLNDQHADKMIENFKNLK